MESTDQAFRFVRCPKCLKVLTEFAEIPIYKCGGCSAMLRAKVRSSSCTGQNLSSYSAIPASQSLPDSDTSSNESERPIQRISTTYVSDNIDKKESPISEQIKSENLNSSEINGNIEDGKKEPSGFREDAIGERLEDFNEDLKMSPNANSNLEIYHSLKSSDELEELSKDVNKSDFGTGTHFRMMTNKSSPPAYEGSASSTDDDRKAQILRFSRRTFRSKSFLNSTKNTGENLPKRSNERLHSTGTDKLSSTQDIKTIEQHSFTSDEIESEDVKVRINHSISKLGNQARILSRVDELRNELTGLFNETAIDSTSKTTQFQWKVPSKERQSLPISFSRQESYSYYQSCLGAKYSCKSFPHNILSPDIQNSTINQDMQSHHFKVSRPQNSSRLCRPVSGGAPFVICYKCFKLLLLPEDFLVSLKRANRLRCGGCYQVLEYCFKPRSRSILQTPVEVLHSPSDENDEFFVENLTPRHKEITAWEAPISSSECNSSEVEPALQKSRSLDESVEEEGSGDGEYMRGSCLHNLMGYSSATELLFHNGYSHDEFQSTESDSPKIYRPFGRKRWERR